MVTGILGAGYIYILYQNMIGNIVSHVYIYMMLHVSVILCNIFVCNYTHDVTCIVICYQIFKSK